MTTLRGQFVCQMTSKAFSQRSSSVSLMYILHLVEKARENPVEFGEKLDITHVKALFKCLSANKREEKERKKTTHCSQSARYWKCPSD